MTIVSRFRGAAVVAVLVALAAAVSAGPASAARSESSCESQLNVVNFWTPSLPEPPRALLTDS